MIDTSNGFIKISDELTIFPGFSFEQFKQTKFYKNQDGVRVINLDGLQIIDNRNYFVSLFFRYAKIYMVSLVCDDKEFSEEEEYKRKVVHDEILNELYKRTTLHDEILNELWWNRRMEYSWGKILSDYDARSNESSINIVYF